MSERSIEDAFDEKFGTTYSRTSSHVKKRCPECGQKALSCSVDKGVFRCFACEYAGKIDINGCTKKPVIEDKVDYPLLQEMLNKIAEEKEHSGLPDEYRDLLRKRGIYHPEKFQICKIPARIEVILGQYYTTEQLIQAGIISYDDEGKIKRQPAFTADRLMVPYVENGKITACKTRISVSGDQEDKNKRYLIPRGTKIGRMLWHPPKLGSDVILTEGELKAMAACDVGFSACALPGVGCLSGCIPTLSRLLKQYGTKRLFIIFDTDNEFKTKVGIVNQAVRAADRFDAISTLLFLPQEKENEKMDLDKFLTKYGPDYLYQLMEDAWARREEIKAMWKIKLGEMKIELARILRLEKEQEALRRSGALTNQSEMIVQPTS